MVLAGLVVIESDLGKVALPTPHEFGMPADNRVTLGGFPDVNGFAVLSGESRSPDDSS